MSPFPPLAVLLVVCSLSSPAWGQNAPAIVGAWRVKTGQVQVDSIYAPDGRYSSTIQPADGPARVVQGRYQTAGDGLEVTLADGKVSRLRFRLLDPNTLELTDANGNSTRMARVAAVPAPAVPVGLDPNRPVAPDLTKLGKSPSGHIVYVRHEMVRIDAPGVAQALPIPKLFIMDGQGAGQAPFICPPAYAEVRNPQWSPDGSALVFASNFELARSVLFTDVFLADLRAGALTRITGSERSAGPVQGFGEIHGIIEDETGQRRSVNQFYVSYQGCSGLAVNPDGWATPKGAKKGCWVFRLRNVPAGKVWVKVWVSRHLGCWKLVDVPTNGIGMVEMDICDGNNQATNPSITPDRRYVVGLWQHPHYFAKAQPLIEDGAQTQMPIHERGFDTVAVFDAARGGLPVASWDPIKMGGHSSKDPKLSPDGRWIALSFGLATYESIGVCSLESMLRGAPDVRAVVPGQQVLAVGGVANTSPAWSPGGRRIAFLRVTHDKSGFVGNICAVNLDGGGMAQVTRVAANQCAANPSWSPDGRRLAFQLLTSKKQNFDLFDLIGVNFTSDIWTIGADGTDPRRLTSDGRSSEPAWGP